MQIFDRLDPLKLERRDAELWMLALAMILVLGGGLAMLLYPAAFSQPVYLSGPFVRKIFFSFCVLCLLLVGYLMDRQMEVRKLRQKLSEEEIRVKRLLSQASADLLETLPGFEHFQDRLAMEFRRSATLQKPLSLVVVRLKPSQDFPEGEDLTASYGDVAKAMVRKLRGEDSIYRFAAGVFGVVLPGVSGEAANTVASRLGEGITDASGAQTRFTFDLRVVNFPEHFGTAREMEQVAASYFMESNRELRAA